MLLAQFDVARIVVSAVIGWGQTPSALRLADVDRTCSNPVR